MQKQYLDVKRQKYLGLWAGVSAIITSFFSLFSPSLQMPDYLEYVYIKHKGRSLLFGSVPELAYESPL